MIEKQLLPSSLISLVILIFLFGSSCGLLGEDEEDELKELIPPEEELIPLKVGNYWVYEQWHMNPEWKDTVREEVLNVHNIIANDTEIRAYGSYRFHYKDRPREDALVWLRANGPEGFLKLGGRVPTDSLYNLDEGLYFKYPASIGEEWEHTSVVYFPPSGTMSLGDSQTITLVDTGKTVKTPAGTFENCYVYTHWGFSNSDYVSLEKHYFYVKPTVGIVGVDTYSEDNKDYLNGQLRLLEYHLK
ncbi:MAG: hypothetical protein WD016_01680 [Balneolaceae bacterium]